MASRPLRVCYFGTYRSEYSRNQIMLAGLRQAGAEVVECHADLWMSIEDRVQVTRGGWRHPRFWRRVLAAYGSLLRQHGALGPYDVLMVGYPGQFDVYLARLLAWWRRRPLVWDVFMSIYLIAVERHLHDANSLTVSGLRWVERLALRLPEMLIADTREYADWYGRTHALLAGKFRLVPTGADDRRFPWQPLVERQPGEPLRIVYYGTFIPNHGIAYIVEAARRLSDEPRINFELIGDGPERPLAQELVERWRLNNVTLVPWLAPEALVARVAQAQVVLGAFGLTPQSMMTVQNKIYEGLALGRTVITGDSPAVRAAFEAGQELLLVDRQDAGRLAAALRGLLADPAQAARLAAAGHQRFVKDYRVGAIGRQTLSYLEQL